MYCIYLYNIVHFNVITRNSTNWWFGLPRSENTDLHSSGHFFGWTQLNARSETRWKRRHGPDMVLSFSGKLNMAEKKCKIARQHRKNLLLRWRQWTQTLPTQLLHVDSLSSVLCSKETYFANLCDTCRFAVLARKRGILCRVFFKGRWVLWLTSFGDLFVDSSIFLSQWLEMLAEKG